MRVEPGEDRIVNGIEPSATLTPAGSSTTPVGSRCTSAAGRAHPARTRRARHKARIMAPQGIRSGGRARQATATVLAAFPARPTGPPRGQIPRIHRGTRCIYTYRDGPPRLPRMPVLLVLRGTAGGANDHPAL